MILSVDTVGSVVSRLCERPGNGIKGGSFDPGGERKLPSSNLSLVRLSPMAHTARIKWSTPPTSSPFFEKQMKQVGGVVEDGRLPCKRGNTLKPQSRIGKRR